MHVILTLHKINCIAPRRSQIFPTEWRIMRYKRTRLCNKASSSTTIKVKVYGRFGNFTNVPKNKNVQASKSKKSSLLLLVIFNTTFEAPIQSWYYLYWGADTGNTLKNTELLSAHVPKTQRVFSSIFYCTVKDNPLATHQRLIKLFVYSENLRDIEDMLIEGKAARQENVSRFLHFFKGTTKYFRNLSFLFIDFSY